MPYSDPERDPTYFPDYPRLRRAGDQCSTPVQPAVSLEFRLETAGDVIALVENQVQAVLDDADAGTLEKARCVGYLATVSLKAIDAGNLAARVEALEAVLKQRKGD